MTQVEIWIWCTVQKVILKTNLFRLHFGFSIKKWIINLEACLSSFQHSLQAFFHTSACKEWLKTLGGERQRGMKPLAPTFRPAGTCRAPGCLSQKEQLHKGSDAPLPFQWGWFYENTFDWMTSCEVMLTFLLQSTIKPQSDWFHPTPCCLSSGAPYHLVLSFSFFVRSLSLSIHFSCAG